MSLTRCNNVSRSTIYNNAKASLNHQGDIGLGAQNVPVGVTAATNPTNIVKAIEGYLNSCYNSIDNWISGPLVFPVSALTVEITILFFSG